MTCSSPSHPTNNSPFQPHVQAHSVQDHTTTQVNPSARSSTHDHFSELPLELAFLILCHLPYRSLAALSRVSQYCRQLTFQQDDILWYKLCQRHNFLLPNPETAHHRWTLEEALYQRPGFSRALEQSRQRLIPQHVSETTQEHAIITGDQTEIHRQQNIQRLRPSARVRHGRVESWRDYFETSLILEREWTEGRYKIKELYGHGDAILCVKALRRGERIVSGDRMGFLRIWCAVTGALLKEFKRHMMGISCLVVQGDVLISGSWVRVEPLSFNASPWS
jgi:hypothetical protein